MLSHANLSLGVKGVSPQCAFAPLPRGCTAQIKGRRFSSDSGSTAAEWKVKKCFAGRALLRLESEGFLRTTEGPLALSP